MIAGQDSGSRRLRGLIRPGRANVIIDGQWGSTGKGKLAGWLCNNYDIDVAVCDFMPNAGHTYVEDDGRKYVFRQLPIAAAFPRTRIYIGPHSAIDPDALNEDMSQVDDGLGLMDRLQIHPLASIILDKDRDVEQAEAGRIANTAKGGHSSYAAKALRSNSAVLARDFFPPEMIADTHALTQAALASGQTVLVESAQGFDLGLHHGTAYPHVTGRDCLVGRALDNAGVPVSLVGSIIASLRTFPIRVGHTEHGHSGPCYPGQQELSWEDMARFNPAIVPETTTVTGRVRRIFSWSEDQIARFCRYVRPSHAFLNFLNYYPTRDAQEFVLRTRSQTLQSMGCDLVLAGTGPLNRDMQVVPDHW